MRTTRKCYDDRGTGEDINKILWERRQEGSLFCLGELETLHGG